MSSSTHEPLEDVSSLKEPFILISYGAPVEAIQGRKYTNKYPWLAVLRVRDGFQGWFLRLQSWVPGNLGKIANADMYTRLREGLVETLEVTEIIVLEGAKKCWSYGPVERTH